MTDLIILFLLILAGGFFGFSEIALAAAKKTRLEALHEEGNERAGLALSLSGNPNRLLGTTQLGLTFVTLIEGAFAKDSFTAPVVSIMPDWEWLVDWKISIATGFVMFLVTMGTIVFGEMLPKRAALLQPEKSAILVAPLVNTFSRIVGVAISVLSWLTDRFMALLGLPLVKEDAVSAEDIENMLDAGAKEGLLAPQEKRMLDAVWRMDERSVKAMMTPRSDIIYIDLDNELEANIEIVVAHPGKTLIVCHGGLDHILGIGDREGWLRKLLKGERDFDWATGIKPSHGIPDTLNMMEAMESMRKYKSSAAIVFDEFGRASGLITVSDMMQTVTGTVDESQDDNALIHKDGHKWLIDGFAPMDDVIRELNLSDVENESISHYKTAGGFAFFVIGKQKGRLPKEFDTFEKDDYTFQVVDIDRSNGYRGDQLMVEKIVAKND